jgi:hypothetical protein
VLMATITTRQLATLARSPGKSLSRSLNHGHGSLLFRAQKTGIVSAAYRYIDQGCCLPSKTDPLRGDISIEN